MLPVSGLCCDIWWVYQLDFSPCASDVPTSNNTNAISMYFGLAVVRNWSDLHGVRCNCLYSAQDNRVSVDEQ